MQKVLLLLLGAFCAAAPCPGATALEKQCCAVTAAFGFAAGPGCCGHKDSATRKIVCTAARDAVEKIEIALDYREDGFNVKMPDFSSFGELTELTIRGSDEAKLTGDVADPLPAKLKKLDLANNDLSSFLALDVSNLVYIDLKNNGILEASFCKSSDVNCRGFSPELTHLDLSYLHETSSMEFNSIRTLTKLTYLDLRRIPFADPVLPSIASLASASTLKWLALRLRSGVAGWAGQAFPDMSAFQALEHLDFRKLKFNPPTSIWINDLPKNLEYLDLSECVGCLSHSSPNVPNFNQFTRLTYLDTSAATPVFDGTFTFTATFPKLEYMDLSGTTAVPTQLTVRFTNNFEQRLPKISYLRLSFITAEFSLTGILSIRTLEYLSLRGTPFKGAVLEKDMLKSLAKLTHLDLAKCALSGNLPVFPSLINLDFLRLDENGFTGQLPALDGIPNVSYLQLDTNFLSGPIHALSRLQGLSSLDITYNAFTGPVAPLIGLRLRKVNLEFNLLTSDTIKEREWLDTILPNGPVSATQTCLTSDDGQYRSFHPLLCPQERAVFESENLPLCASNAVSNINGWSSFYHSVGNYVPGNFGGICKNWNQIQWNRLLQGITSCNADEKMQVEAFVTALTDSCNSYSGTDILAPTFGHALAQNGILRGADFVAQAIALVDNMLRKPVFDANGDLFDCWKDCIDRIPNYIDIETATTPSAALVAFTKMCTTPRLSLARFTDCVADVRNDGQNFCFINVESGRASAFEITFPYVCPQYCTSSLETGCFCAIAGPVPYQFVERGSLCRDNHVISDCSGGSSSDGYHCYNLLSSPVPVCGGRYCPSPEQCYCDRGATCVATPSRPQGKCVVTPKAVATIESRKLIVGESILVNVSSNAYDWNGQTMTVVSVRVSDGTTSILLDKNTCWGNQLNANSPDAQEVYSFNLPTRLVFPGVVRYSGLLPTVTGQLCTGAEAISVGIALPDLSILYTVTIAIRYSPLVKRADDPFLDGVASFTFKFDSFATDRTSSTTSSTSTSTKSSTTSAVTSTVSASNSTSVTATTKTNTTLTSLPTSTSTTATSTLSLSATTVSTTSVTTSTSSASSTTSSITTTTTSLMTTTTKPQVPNFIINAGGSGDGSGMSVIFGGGGQSGDGGVGSSINAGVSDGGSSIVFG
ncbi:hypothetical protein BDR26DRAFT_865507 [Obelidium mucronatum]|nr:hypothetical protein BDR26DRAFT_865507 [Obelidium mucronatum]